MARTLSVAPVDPADPHGAHDLDDRIVDGLEALRQRIVQRLRFPRGTSPFDLAAGTTNVTGHRITVPLAARAISDAIRDEGADEVLAVTDVIADLDRPTRQLRYSASVSSIHGPIPISVVVPSAGIGT